MGTIPTIRLKGLSTLLYVFEWDKQLKQYAYEPKNQREIDDIFRTAGRIYKTMRFSVRIDGESVSEQNDEFVVTTNDSSSTHGFPEELEGFEEVEEKKDLLGRCRKLGISVIPQDRPSSLKRLLTAFKLGSSYV